MRFATTARGTNVVPKQILPPKITDRDAATSFSAVIIGFKAKQLAAASGRTVEAAKEWIAGTRMPSGASLINMARSLPCVLAWINEQAMAGHKAAMARSDDSVVGALRKLSDREGPEGDAVRAILAELSKGGRR
jgi:hypothetical protein